MRRIIKRESTAWQFLANKLEAQDKMSLLTYAFAEPNERCLGLCAEVSMLREAEIIDYETADKMGNRLDDAVRERNRSESGYDCYVFPKGQVKPRIVLAQLHAFLARQDERRAAREARKTKFGEAPSGDLLRVA